MIKCVLSGWVMTKTVKLIKFIHLLNHARKANIEASTSTHVKIVL